MQKKMVDKRVSKGARVEVLSNFWDKILGQMQVKSRERPEDKQMAKIILKLMFVPPEIRKQMLECFVAACKDLYGLAFYQWRHKYPYYRYYDYDRVK